MRTAVYLVLAAAWTRAADVPMTLVSEDEAEPIHSAIVRKEAWTQDAVRRLRAEMEPGAGSQRAAPAAGAPAAHPGPPAHAPASPPALG